MSPRVSLWRLMVAVSLSMVANWASMLTVWAYRLSLRVEVGGR